MKKDRDAALRKLLKKDPLVGPFLNLPCKEAASTSRGLRRAATRCFWACADRSCGAGRS